MALGWQKRCTVKAHSKEVFSSDGLSSNMVCFRPATHLGRLVSCSLRGSQSQPTRPAHYESKGNVDYRSLGKVPGMKPVVVCRVCGTPFSIHQTVREGPVRERRDVDCPVATCRATWGTKLTAGPIVTQPLTEEQLSWYCGTQPKRRMVGAPSLCYRKRSL
ncbi:MAG: hypothetical protein JWN34_610 [Bryobacterales bacterium]|nr:hypothetical protein [Bryobacterales bacterium]